MKNAVLIIIISVVAAAVLLAGIAIGAVSAIFANRPENVAATALMGAAEGLTERQEIKPLINTFSKGSVTASVKDITLDGEDMMEGFEVSGKVYFSEKDRAFMIEDLLVKKQSSKIMGDVYVSPEMVYVYEQEILGEGYGVELGKLTDDFRNSIFAHGSGSDYEISDEITYNQIIDILEIADQAAAMSNDKQMQKDAEKVIEEIYTQAWKIAGDNFEFTSENDEVRIAGTRENVRVITIVIDGESLAFATEELYEFLANDDSMVKFLEKYEEEYSVLFEKIPVYDNDVFDKDMSPAELYETALEEIGKNIDDICDSIEDGMEQEELTLKLITPRWSSKLVQLEIIVSDESIFTLEIGMDGIEKTDKVTVTVYEESMVFEIEENTKDTYSCYLEVEESRIELNVNRSKQNYILQFKEDGETFCTVSGTLAKKGDTVTVTLDKITTEYYDGQEVIECKIEVTMDQNDKIPAAPKDYKTVSEITEADIERWMKKAEEFADSLYDAEEPSDIDSGYPYN